MKIKGFDKDLKCRGFQFKVGETYDTGAKRLELCSNTVFHYCKSLQNVHSFYNCEETNRFCEIEIFGEEITDGEKCGSNKIKIIREIVGEELNQLKGLINGNTGLFNTGRWNSGRWNSGYSNSGNRNSGNRNSGDCNSGDWNTGDCNSGHCNSGNRNSGNRNSGDCNSGDWNSGYWNSGGWNSGYRNSGNWNTGAWNSCNKETGFFNTITPKIINVFNKPCDIEEWTYSLKPSFICFSLVEYIDNKLIKYNYKEAFQKSYNDLNEEEKEIQTELLKALPNFDANVFYEISGIRID